MGAVTFIIALIITALPFASIFYLMKLSFVKETVTRSLIVAIGLLVLSFYASTIALKVFDLGVPKHIEMNRLDNGCDMTPLLFIFLGFIFTLLTFIFGLIYTFTNYKNRHILK